MSGQGTIWSRMLIIAFGAAIVALGANQLNREYKRRYAAGKGPGSLENTQTTNVIERAQMRPSTVERVPSGSDSVSNADKNELQSLIDTVSK